VEQWDVSIERESLPAGRLGYTVKISCLTEPSSVVFSTHDFERVLQFMIDFLEDSNASS